MLDSDPDRRGRTSVCRRITPFLDQRINAKFAKSMSACLTSGRKRRQSLSPRAWQCHALTIHERIGMLIISKLATAKGPGFIVGMVTLSMRWQSLGQTKTMICFCRVNSSAI